jgi:hypothetical protein
MNALNPLVDAHPWWVVALVVAPLFIAVWAATGSHFLESRYGSDVFGRAERS